MANVNNFNYELDKITEREVVYDFVSRLSLGRALINEDYKPGDATFNDKVAIFPEGAKLKDDVISNIIKAMDMTDIIHLDKIKTAYSNVFMGEKYVMIEIPSDCTLYRIIQESTGYDVTKCFKKVANYYRADFDIPISTDDIYKAYYYLP